LGVAKRPEPGAFSNLILAFCWFLPMRGQKRG
jgi:hypothetical protein